jgi:hypothetical protein
MLELIALGEGGAARARRIAAGCPSIPVAGLPFLAPIPEPRRGALARFVITNLQGAQIQARAARDPRFLLEAGELSAALIAQALSECSHAGTEAGKKIQPRGSRKSH